MAYRNVILGRRSLMMDRWHVDDKGQGFQASVVGATGRRPYAHLPAREVSRLKLAKLVGAKEGPLSLIA